LNPEVPSIESSIRSNFAHPASELLRTFGRFLRTQQTILISREPSMAHALHGSYRLIAAASVAGLVSAGVVVLSATVVGERLVAMQRANATAMESPRTALTINREAKGDKLPAPSTKQARSEIKSVEVIGLSNASIVYRDRSGNILFQTDPVANVTVVTKNVDLPEVTIRETQATQVERMPVEEAGPSAPPHGCESAFASPSPESLTRKPSRCVTQLEHSERFAALR
jgi:hypothetical protein